MQYRRGSTMPLRCYLPSILLLCSLSSVFAVTNTDITRVIDLTKSVARVKMTIRAQSVSKEYLLAFPSSLASNLAFLSVAQGGTSLPVSKPILRGNVTMYSVAPSGNSVVLDVLAVFTESLVPYPQEIGQNENQLVVYTDNAYVTSPYGTNTQKTTLKLASTMIETYSRVDPSTVKGTSLVYGPYSGVAANQFQQLRVHFQHHKPFARFSSCVREVEVSHWGNIAVEEVYELQHAGAKLKGGFSRFEYMMRRADDGPSFRTIRAILPAKAENLYYRDQIGNISTSDIAWNDDALELELSTRFPLFGGWKTQFYIGYSVPTTLFLYRNETHYNLKFNFFVPFEDVWVSDMTLKIILPEGATDVSVEAPYNVTMDTATRFTYLDSKIMGGRPVVIMKKSNLVEEHVGMIRISYKYNQAILIIKPLILVVSFLAFYTVCIVVARVQSSNNPGKPQ